MLSISWEEENQVIIKRKSFKLFPSRGNWFLMKYLFSFCPCKTDTLILKAQIILQKTCKLNSVSAALEEHCSLTHSNSTQGCSRGVAIFHYTRLISFDDQTFKKCERLELYFCLESSDDSWRSLSKVQFTLTNYTNLLKKTEREVAFPPLTVLYNLIAQL